MQIITSLIAQEILDSRGTPTVSVECCLLGGARGVASVPSGASTGAHESVELRDGDLNRYRGKGVLKVVSAINGEIFSSVVGRECDQKLLDELLVSLDGSDDRSRLGANALLGVSMAFARASAEAQRVELYQYLGDLIKNDGAYRIPQPMFNVINGGKHSDSGIDVQEFMLVPIAFDSLSQKIQVVYEIIFVLKDMLSRQGCVTSLGDEGGFAPALVSSESALDLLVNAIQNAGYSTDQVKIALDVAASSFVSDEVYRLRLDGEYKSASSKDLFEWYQLLIEKYPIVSIEDPFSEEDWGGFASLNSASGKKVMIVGDDLTVTNVKRISEAVSKGAINTVLIKPNQIGTISETISAIQLTHASGWNSFVSHRSGETNDTFIADLAVGCGCGYIKSGSLARGERVCKYNRLMEIERLIQ